MIALSSPNHPLRLAGLFAAGLGFFAIVGGAIFASAWMVDDQRSARESHVLGAAAAPPVEAPAGLIAVQRVNSIEVFEELAGFKPFIPMYVPGATKNDFTLAVTQADASGRRTGRVGYASKEIAGADGITGPAVVLLERPGAPAADADPRLQRVTQGGGRALVATIACGTLTVDVQLYFGPKPGPDETIVTPHMLAVGQEFLDGVNEQCGQ